jgi:hypothetical protein
MLLFDRPSQSPNPKQPHSVTNGAPSLQQIPAGSREFTVAAAATDSEPESGRHNSHSSSSPSSSPIHLSGTIYDWSSYPSSSNKFGVNQNSINFRQDPRLTRPEPPQPLPCDSNAIGSPLSPTASTSVPESNTVKTPMEMLAESMKGRMLFAIPKKGTFD